MSIKLVIDTCSDLTQKDLDDDVTIFPIPVYIDGKEYRPNVDLSVDEFYTLLAQAKEFPKTSQTPFVLMYDTFKKMVENGNEVVCILMASKMSGTYQSACLAKQTIADDLSEELASKIHIIDSENVTFPLAALCIEAYKMVKEGKMTAQEIEDRIRYLIPKVKMRAFIKDLTYLKMGGRISGATAALAGLLGIKPIIKVEAGEISTTNKERGIPNAMKRICTFVNESNIDTSLPCYLGYTQDTHIRDLLIESLKKNTNFNISKIISIGATVGAHAGPGCTGVCFFEK